MGVLKLSPLYLPLGLALLPLVPSLLVFCIGFKTLSYTFPSASRRLFIIPNTPSSVSSSSSSSFFAFYSYIALRNPFALVLTSSTTFAYYFPFLAICILFSSPSTSLLSFSVILVSNALYPRYTFNRFKEGTNLRQMPRLLGL